MKFLIQDKETGTLIDEFSNKKDAEREIKEFEMDDQKQGYYKEGFYEIVEQVNQ